MAHVDRGEPQDIFALRPGSINRATEIGHDWPKPKSMCPTKTSFLDSLQRFKTLRSCKRTQTKSVADLWDNAKASGNSRPDAASPTSWGPGLEPSWTSRLGLIAAEKATLSPTASQEESDGSDLIGWEAGTRDQPFSAKWVTLASDSATVARYYVHVRSRFSVPTPVACKSAISNTYFGAPEHVIGTVSRYSPSLDVDQSAANFQASCASPVSIGSVKDSFNLEQPCSKLQTEQVEMTPRPSSTTVCDVRAACLDLAQNKSARTIHRLDFRDASHEKLAEAGPLVTLDPGTCQHSTLHVLSAMYSRSGPCFGPSPDCLDKNKNDITDGGSEMDPMTTDSDTSEISFSSVNHSVLASSETIITSVIMNADDDFSRVGATHITEGLDDVPVGYGSSSVNVNLTEPTRNGKTTSTLDPGHPTPGRRRNARQLSQSESGLPVGATVDSAAVLRKISASRRIWGSQNLGRLGASHLTRSTWDGV